MALFQNTTGIVKNEVESQLSIKFRREIKIHLFNSIGGGCINHASKIETNVGDFFFEMECKLPG